VKRIQIARRKPQRTIERLRIQLAEQAATIKLLQDEFGSLLDLVPLVDFTEGADQEMIRWVMNGTFLPHIAMLMASTLVAFEAPNGCEWHLLGDPRGEFVLYLQRKAGATVGEQRDAARDKARLIETRLADLNQGSPRGVRRVYGRNRHAGAAAGCHISWDAGGRAAARHGHRR
jgi:hypothetical protein